MGCLFFGSLATFGIVSEFVRDYNDPLQSEWSFRATATNTIARITSTI
jgi:hypothetical protein